MKLYKNYLVRNNLTDFNNMDPAIPMVISSGLYLF